MDPLGVFLEGRAGDLRKLREVDRKPPDQPVVPGGEPASRDGLLLLAVCEEPVDGGIELRRRVVLAVRGKEELPVIDEAFRAEQSAPVMQEGVPVPGGRAGGA